ncbi:unnamed protein product [Arabidopsis halleri]
MRSSSQATAELVSPVAIEIYVWFSDVWVRFRVRLVSLVSVVREVLGRRFQRGSALASGFGSEELFDGRDPSTDRLGTLLVVAIAVWWIEDRVSLWVRLIYRVSWVTESFSRWIQRGYVLLQKRRYDCEGLGLQRVRILVWKSEISLRGLDGDCFIGTQLVSSVIEITQACRRWSRGRCIGGQWRRQVKIVFQGKELQGLERETKSQLKAVLSRSRSDLGVSCEGLKWFWLRRFGSEMSLCKGSFLVFTVVIIQT